MTQLNQKMTDVQLQQKSEKLFTLTKKLDPILAQYGLADHTAQVALMLDYSGSMQGLYNSGAVQTLVERVLPFAVRFDDNAEIDVFFFPNRRMECTGVTPDNFEGCVNRITAGHSMGSTPFDNAFEQVFKHYSFRENRGTPKDMPVYLIFVTDGAPDDRRAAVRMIEESARYPMFTQFIAIGEDWPAGDDLTPNQSQTQKKSGWRAWVRGGSSSPSQPRTQGMRFLVELDEEMDTEVDACNAFAVKNPATVDETRLYSLMVREYPLWIPEARKHGLIV